MVENSREPLTIELDPFSTFEDVKKKIQSLEDLDPLQQELFHHFYPLNDSMVVEDVLEEGAIVTAVIAKTDLTENVSKTLNETERTVHLIRGGRERLDIIPLSSSDGRKLPPSSKFGIITEKTGEDGLRIFTCKIYKVQDDTDMDIVDDKIFQCSGTHVELPMENQMTFKEGDLKKGSFIDMQDALRDIADLLELEDTDDGIALAVGLQEVPQEQDQESEKGRLLNNQLLLTPTNLLYNF